MLLVIILAYGILLRGWRISEFPLWVDEAETSINALSILQHGVPRDHYLGLPIFENTFSEPWPDSREYAFKDTSYSDTGLAIYHGWLPLYAGAASFALHGVEPDDDPTALTPRHSEEAMRLRTRAARTPALVFAGVFLVAIFFAARELYGIDAAWAALVGTAVSSSAISFGRQARYYSLTLALTALCCLALCLIVRRGRWRDVALGGALFVLLFHTNLLSFLTICAVTILVIPSVRSHARIGAKGLLFAGIVGAGTVPWIVYTGFLASATDRPMARSLLTLAEVLRYPLERLPYVLLAIAAMAWLVAAPKLRQRVSDRFIEPFVSHRAAFVLTGAWTLVAFLLFVLLVPAASHFHSRLTLVLLVPAILFGAMLFAAGARIILRHHSSTLGPALFILVLLPAGRTMFWLPPGDDEPQALYAVIDRLRALDLRPGTRLYTESSENLVMRFYTGMPFQNVMPVRKGFLDSYDGELLILESSPFELVSPKETEEFLRSRGASVRPGYASVAARQASTNELTRDLRSRGIALFPSLEAVTDDVRRLIEYQREKTASTVAEDVAESGNPMFAGYNVRDYRDMWQVFFFRFVNPEAHTGARLNYAERVRGASASLLPGASVLIRSPARSDDGVAGCTGPPRPCGNQKSTWAPTVTKRGV